MELDFKQVAIEIIVEELRILLAALKINLVLLRFGKVLNWFDPLFLDPFGEAVFCLLDRFLLLVINDLLGVNEDLLIIFIEVEFLNLIFQPCVVVLDVLNNLVVALLEHFAFVRSCVMAEDFYQLLHFLVLRCLELIRFELKGEGIVYLQNLVYQTFPQAWVRECS